MEFFCTQKRKRKKEKKRENPKGNKKELERVGIFAAGIGFVFPYKQKLCSDDPTSSLDSFFQTQKHKHFGVVVFLMWVCVCGCVSDLGQVHSFLVLVLVLVALLCLLAATWF
jgi:hypothetical protein